MTTEIPIYLFLVFKHNCQST